MIHCLPYGGDLACISYEHCCSVLVLISKTAAVRINKDPNSQSHANTASHTPTYEARCFIFRPFLSSDVMKLQILQDRENLPCVYILIICLYLFYLDNIDQ